MGLNPRTGTSHDGHPLSLSRTPPPDLAPFVARFFLLIIERPDDSILESFLLHETAYIRVPVIGQWETQVGGRWVAYEGPMIFGAQRKRFPVRCAGPIIAAGFALRPAAWFAFSDLPAHRIADRLDPIDGAWGEALRWACEDIYQTDRTFDRLEQVVRDRVNERAVKIDPALERFEAISRLDPSRPVADIARELGMIPRRLDRHVRAHFGHPPKTVLRRGRFLDMAAMLRGFSPTEDGEQALLRFYDASHLNREFRLFLDMPPKRFRDTPTLLFTPGLEVREQRKIAEQAAGHALPWIAPAASRAAE
ncbi:MAG: AraC family transcriptional regulator [Candidatus Sphingomonas colombiensis]|nr:AraC family transcriptional regulator [Sphingomonas sp.]WEK44532.1 MAG: AraC family transcriptional regulator [Sphingomonas sp.]